MDGLHGTLTVETTTCHWPWSVCMMKKHDVNSRRVSTVSISSLLMPNTLFQMDYASRLYCAGLKMYLLIFSDVWLMLKQSFPGFGLVFVLAFLFLQARWTRTLPSHYHFGAHHTQPARNLKCASLNDKVEESRAECWEGRRWIKWRCERWHRCSERQITASLSSRCVALTRCRTLSRPTKSKEIRESSEETGNFFSFSFSFFSCLFPCPFTVLPQSEQSFQRRGGAVWDLGGAEWRDGSRKRTILETWNSLWSLAQKKEKHKTQSAPKPKDQIWEVVWCA